MNFKNIFTAFWLVLFLIFSGNARAQDWVFMRSDSLKFNVLSPEKLVPKTNEAMTELGVLTVNSFGHLPEDGDNLIYQVIVLNYPEGSLPMDSIELKSVMLNELVQQSAAANDAEVIYNQEYSQDGLEGIQWRVHSGDEIVIKSRAFIYDDKIYIAQVMSKKIKSLNDDINKFLDGFHIETLE